MTLQREPFLGGPALRVAMLKTICQQAKQPCSLCMQKRAMSALDAMRLRVRWVLGDSIISLAKDVPTAIRLEQVRSLIYGLTYLSPTTDEVDGYTEMIDALLAVLDAHEWPWHERNDREWGAPLQAWLEEDWLF